MKVFSLYVLLLGAYNPITTYIFNNTGFHGAGLHQVIMFSGIALFLALNIRVVIAHIRNSEVIALLTLFVFSLFSFLNADSGSNPDALIVSTIFAFEFYLFYIIGSRIRYIMTIESGYSVFSKVLLINAVCVVCMWLFVPKDMYFRLNLGGGYVARVLDFIVGLLLILIFSKTIDLSKSKIIHWFYLIITLFAVVIGFSRAVWLSLLFAYAAYFFIIRLKFSFKFSAKRAAFYLLIFILLNVVLYVTGLSHHIGDRLVLNNPDESSYSGRISAYLSLLHAIFSNVETFLVGRGAGVSMPGLDIPVSSSPSFLLGFLYTNGAILSLVFIFLMVYMAFNLLRNFMKRKDTYSLFGFLSFIYFFVLLNIFPSVSHFPSFGYLGFIVGISLMTNSKKIPYQTT